MRVKANKCHHGNINCLLCLDLYSPITREGVIKYMGMIDSKALSDRETVFLKSKIMAGLTQGIDKGGKPPVEGTALCCRPVTIPSCRPVVTNQERREQI